MFLNESFLRRLVSACPAIPKHHDRISMAVAEHTPRAASNPAQKRVFSSAVARSVKIFKNNYNKNSRKFIALIIMAHIHITNT